MPKLIKFSDSTQLNSSQIQYYFNPPVINSLKHMSFDIFQGSKTFHERSLIRPKCHARLHNAPKKPLAKNTSKLMSQLSIYGILGNKTKTKKKSSFRHKSKHTFSAISDTILSRFDVPLFLFFSFVSFDPTIMSIFFRMN